MNPLEHSGMYLYDGIGNPVGLLTDTGTRAYDVSFDPFGIQTINAGGSSDWYGNTPYGFKAGTRTDGDALVKFGLRWYLPSVGTWTQRDTLDAPLDPHNANRYAYAGDDPINGSDPTGRIYFTGPDFRDIGKQTTSAAFGLVYGVPINGAVAGVCAASALLGCIPAGLAGAYLDNALANASADYVYGDKVSFSAW